MEVYIRPRHSHSNSFGNDAEKDTAGCRAFNRKYIVIGGDCNMMEYNYNAKDVDELIFDGDQQVVSSER